MSTPSLFIQDELKQIYFENDLYESTRLNGLTLLLNRQSIVLDNIKPDEGWLKGMDLWPNSQADKGKNGLFSNKDAYA